MKQGGANLDGVAVIVWIVCVAIATFWSEIRKCFVSLEGIMKQENPIGNRKQLREIEARMRAEYGTDISEREFLQQVRELASWSGWKVFHTYDSRRSEFGFPDLCLVRPPRLIFAELKTDSGRVTPEQTVWLNELGRVPNIETHVWKPADLDTIRKILAR